MFDDDVLDDAVDQADALLSAPPAVPGVAEVSESDPIAELIEQQQTLNIQASITAFLLSIEGFCNEHAQAALKNGHRTIYSDYIVLRDHARRVGKNLKGREYWRTING